MIEKNTSLLVLSLDGSLFSFADFPNILEAVEINTQIKKVSFPNLIVDLTSLMTVYETLDYLQLRSIVDVSPHFLDVEDGIFCFSPYSFTQVFVAEVSSIQSFLERFSIKELTLQRSCIDSESIDVLCDLIRANNSLTSVDFSNMRMSEELSHFSDDFYCSHSNDDSNANLKNVSICNNSIGLGNLCTIFGLNSTGKFSPNFQISPHDIDVSFGYIDYEHHVTSADLVALLNALKSNVPIKRVESRGFNNLNLGGIIALFEISSIAKSVINLDVSPHCVDINNGVFRFSPETLTKISAQELSSLHCLLKSFSFKELILKKCQISDTEISVLCDIIRTCHSLTSVDFSYCRLSYTSIHDIMITLQSNSSLKTINLSYTDIDFNSILVVYKFIVTSQSPPTIELCPHFIDLSSGVIQYAGEIKNTDLRFLSNTLKSGVPVKRIECSGIAYLNFVGTVALFQIMSINTSLIDVSISPHFIATESGIFSFSPQVDTTITAWNISALSSLDVKDLTSHN
ncbi:hypothetical protein GEMRC1_009525 [Eukaryota sp. GEM-RC1]